MTKESTSIHGMWSSRWAFILAATGSAVGLGNIWKFPYITGEYGGGAFVLVYLICIAVLGIPILCSEIMLGRLGRQSPANTFATIADSIKASKHWRGVGWLGVGAGFLILSFYSVVAGWALAYVFEAMTGAFDGKNADDMAQVFASLRMESANQSLGLTVAKAVGWTSAVILATLLVVGRGVNRGLEKAVSTMMPGMFILLLITLIYAMTTGHFGEALDFLFYPDFSKLSGEAVLVALGHAFFTLSLASGMMLMYGAYLPNKVSLVKTGVTIAIIDTLVALIAGAAIFPIVFANGMEPGAGPGLIFISLPIAFGQMPFGVIIGTLFFIMLVLAAFTSAISLIEASVAWLVERKGFSRPKAAILAGTAVWLCSLGPALAPNVLSGVTIGDKNIFDSVDFLTTNIMLPVCGLLIAVFVGWKLGSHTVAEQMELDPAGPGLKIFKLIIKYIAPVAIVIVFLQNLNVFDLITEWTN